MSTTPRVTTLGFVADQPSHVYYPAGHGHGSVDPTSGAQHDEHGRFLKSMVDELIEASTD